MPAITYLIILGFGFVVFSQFGSRLSARHSSLWVGLILFLLVAAAVPESLSEIAHFFGFTLVSNFVLSSLLFGTFLEFLHQSVSHTRMNRRFREALCREAAERFLMLQGNTSPKVLIVCPCFNEELEISRTISRFRNLIAVHPHLSFCIVNDGSTDLTLRKLVTEAPSNHTRHLTNLGVGAALMTGFMSARDLGAEWVIQCDADGQHPIEEIPTLLSIAEEKQAGLLIGSRFVADSPAENNLESTTWQRWLGGRLLFFILSTFGKHAATRDPTSGFRVYSRQAIEILLRKMPDEYPEPESVAILAAAGMNVLETSVTMQPRLNGVSSLSGGIKSLKFMFKVSASLVGLRFRLLAGQLKFF